jgi:hypothetical protein
VHSALATAAPDLSRRLLSGGGRGRARRGCCAGSGRCRP